MNSKKCEKVMNSFFELDKGERLELHDSLHLIFCKECRTKVRVLSKDKKHKSFLDGKFKACFDDKMGFEWFFDDFAFCAFGHFS